MAVHIVVPKLGMDLANATVREWMASEGEEVAKGQPVVAIETQKTRYEMEAEAAGFLHIVVPIDAEVPVGTAIGLLAATTEELQTLQKQPHSATSAPAVPTAPFSPPQTSTPPPATEQAGRIRISPAARKLAEEHSLDASTIKGTGPEGRIVREDVERAVEAREARKARKAPQALDGKMVKTTIPLKGMRKAIAEHMVRSLSVSAQLTAIGEIDMAGTVALRDTLLAKQDTLGARVSYTDLLVFVLARALREFPLVNSSIVGDDIKVWDSINIGVAVALEDGLIVPVIKDADKKSLVEISQSVRDLAAKARAGTLRPEDVTGGTFTLTNLGAAGAGWRFETSIINQPESAILGVGGITDRVVVRDGQIAVRPIMTYSFTYDHRVIDGALAVKFMGKVVEMLENGPDPALP